MRQWWWRGLVALANLVQCWVVRRPGAYRLLLAPPLAGWRHRLGAWRAWVAHERAYRRVPAYRTFVDAHGGPLRLRLVDGVPDLSAVPETDKASYVDRFGHADRCVDGRLPTRGVVVDESSGSSGRPTSWIRGPEEREVTRRLLQLTFRSALGSEPMFVINAFAMGAWATGLNVTASLGDICTMKSTGPDLDKIVNTLLEFGPDHDYVVLGYPPFLKALAEDPRIDWAHYRVRAAFGGEGISEPLRRHLLRSFTEVLGSYGASDLEINLAAETRFTVRLRQLLEGDAALRARLSRPEYGVLPMVFQYNPMAYHLDTNAAGELVVTLSRPTNVAPKIRYNIHDLGHVARFEEVAAALEACGYGDLVAETRPALLPLLFLYGRSDQSVDYFGATVTPDSVRDILSSMQELGPSLEGFRLIAREDAHHDRSLEVAIELADRLDPNLLDGEALGRELFDRLAAVNGDFANAYRRTATAGQLPRVTLHRRGCGPFADEGGIKRQYVATLRSPAVQPAGQR